MHMLCAILDFTVLIVLIIAVRVVMQCWIVTEVRWEVCPSLQISLLLSFLRALKHNSSTPPALLSLSATNSLRGQISILATMY